MWLLLFSILFCLAPGSMPLTYNGVNSSSIVTIGDVHNNSLSFTLRTRQTNSLVFTTGNSTNNFTAYIDENGVLMFSAMHDSATTTTFKGSTTVNDGLEHTVYLKNTDGSDTELYVDNNLTDTRSSGVVNNLKYFEGQKLYIAIHGTSALKPYEGCLWGLVFGGTNIPLTVSNSSNTMDSCVSSRFFCPSQPCVKGTCVEDFNDFECKCPAFYKQKTCNETFNVNCAFSKNLCNNGTCTNKTSSTEKEYSDNGFDLFECKCDQGFNGTLCTRTTDECESSPCLNNGKCEDLHLDFRCHCTAEYYGTTCNAQYIKSCTELKPCMNGASCENNATGYSCQCTGSFTGKNCTEKTDDGDDDDNLPLILGLSITAVVIVLIIIIVCVVVFCRNKSGMEGTYSPNKEEQTAGNLEMSTVKKPKTERLI